MTAMNFGLLFILLGGNLLPLLVREPPRDLLSLVDPEVILAREGIQADEEALISLLAGKEKARPTEDVLRKAARDLGSEQFAIRQSAAETLAEAGETARPHLLEAERSDDPEVRVTARELLLSMEEKKEREVLLGDRTYLGRLLAVRMLEKMRSKNALTALEALSKADDVSLSHAAAEAIAAIREEKSLRPQGVNDLKAIRKKLPRNPGFVVLADFERGYRERTLREYSEIARKGNPIGAFIAQMGAELDRAAGEAEEEIANFIAQVGNIRIDSVTVIVSGDIEVDDSGYIAFVFKGLHDPGRFGAFCGRQMGQSFKAGRFTVFFGGDAAVCSVDPATLVASFGAGRAGRHIEAVLSAISSSEETAPPDHIAAAFTAMESGQNRIVMSGSLSELQKKEIGSKLDRELQRANAKPDSPEKQQMLCFLNFLGRLCGVDVFAGRIEPGGSVVLEGSCADEKAARELADSLAQVRKAAGEVLSNFARNAVLAGQAEAPNARKPLWKEGVQGRNVTVLLDSLPMPAFLQILFAGPMRAMPPDPEAR